MLNKRTGARGFPGGSAGKESACNVGDLVQSLGWEDPLEKGKATHFSILAWKIPQTGPWGHEELWASLVAQRLKPLPAMWETWVQSLGREDPLEKEMATHSSTLAWRIPWTEEPGGLQSTGLQSGTQLSDFTFTSLVSLPRVQIPMPFLSYNNQNYPIVKYPVEGKKIPLRENQHARSGHLRMSIFSQCYCCHLVARLCLTLCDRMGYSPPGSSVCRISQARILEWVAISFSGDLPNPGIKPWSPTLQADSLPSEPPGKQE